MNVIQKLRLADARRVTPEVLADTDQVQDLWEWAGWYFDREQYDADGILYWRGDMYTEATSRWWTDWWIIKYPDGSTEGIANEEFTQKWQENVEA